VRSSTILSRKSDQKRTLDPTPPLTEGQSTEYDGLRNARWTPVLPCSYCKLALISRTISPSKRFVLLAASAVI
jgi:hypothetical protein